MVIRNYFFVLIMSALTLGVLIRPHTVHASETFSPVSTPSTDEWRHFHQMSDSKRLALWKFQTSRGFNLGSWAWQWRIGWIRQCEKPEAMPSVCPGLLTAGLKDDAMVVRAEAATILGRRFEKNPKKSVIDDLSLAFGDPRNQRGGEPLFVCGRILEALRKIGGKRAVNTATKLAAMKPATKAYWDKLNHVVL